MKTIIQSRNEYLSSTAISGSRFIQPGDLRGLVTEVVGTTAKPFFVVAAPVKVTDTAKEPSDFINELLKGGLIQHTDLSEGRKWVADAFFEEKPISLKVLRMRAGYSQAQLAEKISMSQPNICEFEAGKSKPSVNTLQRLADALGTSADVILKSINELE